MFWKYGILCLYSSTGTFYFRFYINSVCIIILKMMKASSKKKEENYFHIENNYTKYYY